MLCRTIGTQWELAWRRIVVGHGLLRAMTIGTQWELAWRRIVVGHGLLRAMLNLETFELML
ncbi:hypothetical protein HanPSC8_Chr02g0064321 [Helianthus annuus]|nr:hypothetical protein HanPSC8_Chr02g0064321 [Helianthus annuus]